MQESEQTIEPLLNKYKYHSEMLNADNFFFIDHKTFL